MALLTTSELELLFEEIPEEVYFCKGQLSFYDRLIYYWAGRSFFSGFGTLVDAGALIGGTAKLLACGLTKNPRTVDARRRILSYDRFEDTPDGFMAQAISDTFGVTLPPPVNGMVDFEPAFRANTDAFADFIEIKRGDITTVGYSSALRSKSSPSTSARPPTSCSTLPASFSRGSRSSAPSS